MSTFRLSVAWKLPDVTKTSTAQIFSGIKCYFHLVSNRLYAIQTHYEKERMILCFVDGKLNFCVKLYYLQITHKIYLRESK
jgi:hypothetical protein